MAEIGAPFQCLHQTGGSAADMGIDLVVDTGKEHGKGLAVDGCVADECLEAGCLAAQFMMGNGATIKPEEGGDVLLREP